MMTRTVKGRAAGHGQAVLMTVGSRPSPYLLEALPGTLAAFLPGPSPVR